MTLQEAKAFRDKHLNLIGKRAKDFDANVYDVIVVPIDNFEAFIAAYREDLKDVPNNTMILRYPSNQYGVKVIYDYDQEFVDVYSDDLEEYLNR